MNILQKIYQDKLIEVRNKKKITSADQICKQIKCGSAKNISFIKAIEEKIKLKQTAIIAEIKKASPSKGVIRKDFDPKQIAKIYKENGAACISVLTDEKYFMGKNEYLTQAKQESDLPILRKDFIIDDYQILESKLIGADCILLIMAMLSDEQAKNLESRAIDMGLNVLVEVHDEDELKRALKLKTKLIGINNRNLKTLEVNINTSKKLAKMIPENAGYITICESGIKSRADIESVMAYNINTFLIGESLMKEKNIALTLKSLIGTMCRAEEF